MSGAQHSAASEPPEIRCDYGRARRRRLARQVRLGSQNTRQMPVPRQGNPDTRLTLAFCRRQGLFAANSRWENREECPREQRADVLAFSSQLPGRDRLRQSSPPSFRTPTAVRLNTRPPIEASRLRRDLHGPRVLARLAFDHVRPTPGSRLVEARVRMVPIVLSWC